MKAFRKAAALFMVVAIVMTMAAVPAKVQAAAGVPARVIKALEKAVDDDGRCIVIDSKCQRMYLFKKNCRTGKWELKKSFRCICGDYLRPDRHYVLLRNEDTDQRFYNEGERLYEYGMYVDCYETVPEHSMRIHSYAKIGGKIYKNSKKNDTGFAVCKDNAAYIWKWYGDGTAVMGC